MEWYSISYIIIYIKNKIIKLVEIISNYFNPKKYIYKVFDNDMPAVYQNSLGGYESYCFTDLDSALVYAHNWLSSSSPGIELLRDECVNKKFDYNDYGNTIEIRSVKT